MGVKRASDFGLNVRLNTPMSNRKGVADMPDPDRPARERAALQRLLRRRGRRGKVGANPETETKIHAWHSSYSFRPSSDHSASSKVLTGFGVLLVLSLPIAMIVFWETLEDAQYSSSLGYFIFHAAIYGCMILIIATILIAPVLLVAQSLGGAWESRRERRSNAAKASAEDT